MNSLKHITDWPAAGSSVDWKGVNIKNEYLQSKIKTENLSWESDFDLESVNPFDYTIGYGHNYLCQTLLNRYKISDLPSLRKALDDYYDKNLGMENFSSVLESKGFFNRDISYQYSKSLLSKKDDYSRSFLILDPIFEMLSTFQDGMSYDKVRNFIRKVKMIEERVNYDASIAKKEKELTLKVLTTLKHSSAFWYTFFFNRMPNGKGGDKKSTLVTDIDRGPDKWIMSDAAGYMMGLHSSLHAWGGLTGGGAGYLAAVLGGMAGASIISALGISISGESNPNVIDTGITGNANFR